MLSTRDRLIEAAGKLFAKHRFRKTTVSDIAEGAGVVKGAFYHYFRNKEEIFAIVVRTELDQVWRVTRSAVNESPSGPYKFKTFVRVSMREARKRANAYAVLREEFEPLSAIQRLRDETMHEQKNILRDILDEGVICGAFRKTNANDTAEALATVYVSLLLSQELFRGTDEDFEKNLEILLSMLCEGMTSK